MAYGTQFWVLVFSAAGIVFILPTVIGIIRRVDNLALVIVLNVFALVSLGVGWLGALLFACDPRRAFRRPLTPAEVEHVKVEHVPTRDPDLEYIMGIAVAADRLHQQRTVLSSLRSGGPGESHPRATRLKERSTS